MKKIVKIVALLGLGISALEAQRGNIVVHFDKDGVPNEIWSSGGNCRHHLTAHPGDYVRTAAGGSSNPADCN